MPVPVKKESVEEELPGRISPIVVGQTDMAAARALLGAPWLTSEYWHFDLFRTAGRDAKVPVMFVFWWPVPVGVEIDKTTAYILLTYDATGRVSALEHGLARDPSVLAESGNLHAGARVAAGDLRFVASDDGDEASLSIGATARDEYLRSEVAADSCRVVIGCDDVLCSVRAGVDGHAPIEMPAANIAAGPMLIPLQVSPGAHRIEITPNQALLDFETRTEFACAGGETLYGLIKLQPAELKLFRQKMTASMGITRELPIAFGERRLLIWSNGRWLVSPGG